MVWFKLIVIVLVNVELIWFKVIITEKNAFSMHLHHTTNKTEPLLLLYLLNLEEFYNFKFLLKVTFNNNACNKIGTLFFHIRNINIEHILYTLYLC